MNKNYSKLNFYSFLRQLYNIHKFIYGSHLEFHIKILLRKHNGTLKILIYRFASSVTELTLPPTIKMQLYHFEK